MKATHIILSFCALALIFACGAETAEHRDEQKLYKEVFAVHDEVMPKISDVNRLGRELKKWSAGEKLPLDSLQKARVTQVILQLEKADEGMSNWMAEIEDPGDLRSSKSHAEIMQYLRDEQAKVGKVKTDVIEGIQTGMGLLDSLEKIDESL